MPNNSLEEEPTLTVDERLTRVVRIIVAQYDGDVKAFVESVREKTQNNRKGEAASDVRDEATLRQCSSTTNFIGRISRAHYSSREE